MEKIVHWYNLDGLELKIPLKKRRGEQGYIEDYSDLIDNPRYTPLGNPVIFTHSEPCEVSQGNFSDCADCEFFKKANVEHFTLLGICTHESKAKQAD